MSRDYVKKGKPVTRSKAMSNSNSGGNRKVWVALIIVLCITGGFGFFLWTIQNKADNVAAAPTKTPAKQEAPLPAPPKEKWDYVKELPNKTIEVDLPTKAETPSQPYKLQCGSFRTQEQADAMKARIAFAGLESTIRKTEGSSGIWYRVILGPYPQKRLAETDKHKMQTLKIDSCMVSLWT